MRFILLLLALSSAGCSLVPVRVFKDKVPEPVVKGEKQIEAERQAADLLARVIFEPAELKPVAVSLSASLGAPVKPIPYVAPVDLPKAVEVAGKALHAGQVEIQAKRDKLNEQLAENAGKAIEGTGFSIAGPSAILLVVGFVALLILFPSSIGVFMWFYRRLKSTAKSMVTTIEEAANEPETKKAVSIIKEQLSKSMDKKNKKVVLDLKKP